ncbi:hypothetical protein H6P81_004984 [Aristolochia fimbriata]|uniref:Uncharacterized protein n=1 Tax=Aristolochia fimbriata TaxID=158543 RepID=A0AAV7EVH3_ARIFI|nr:hypothetical protein H6P81_004984 [Aristolochia fimbriata]
MADTDLQFQNLGGSAPSPSSRTFNCFQSQFSSRIDPCKRSGPRIRQASKIRTQGVTVRDAETDSFRVSTFPLPRTLSTPQWDLDETPLMARKAKERFSSKNDLYSSASSLPALFSLSSNPFSAFENGRKEKGTVGHALEFLFGAFSFPSLQRNLSPSRFRRPSLSSKCPLFLFTAISLRAISESPRNDRNVLERITRSQTTKSGPCRTEWARSRYCINVHGERHESQNVRGRIARHVSQDFRNILLNDHFALLSSLTPPARKIRELGTELTEFQQDFLNWKSFGFPPLGILLQVGLRSPLADSINIHSYTPTCDFSEEIMMKMQEAPTLSSSIETAIEGDVSERLLSDEKIPARKSCCKRGFSAASTTSTKGGGNLMKKLRREFLNSHDYKHERSNLQTFDARDGEIATKRRSSLHSFSLRPDVKRTFS